MYEAAKDGAKSIPSWVWITVLVVAAYFTLRSGLLSSLFKLGTTVTNVVDSGVKTVARVGADLDPFNSKGRAAKVLRAVDVSKPIKKVGAAIDPSKAVKNPIGTLKSVTNITSAPLKGVGRAIKRLF